MAEDDLQINKLARAQEEGSIRHLGFMVKHNWNALLILGRMIEQNYIPTSTERDEVLRALRVWLHDGQRSVDHANYQHRIAVESADRIREARRRA